MDHPAAHLKHAGVLTLVPSSSALSPYFLIFIKYKPQFSRIWTDAIQSSYCTLLSIRNVREVDPAPTATVVLAAVMAAWGQPLKTIFLDSRVGNCVTGLEEDAF